MSFEHLKPEDIDPYTIFMGNIHPSIPVQNVKESVKKAFRVDVGFAKKHKFGRYAFAKFRNAADARQAFVTLRQMNDSNAGMDMVVRFRRLRGNININGPKPKTVSGTTSQNESKDKEKTHENPEKEPINDIKSNTTASTSIEYITTNLLSNDILDWDKLPLFNLASNNSSLILASGNTDDTGYVGGDLDDLFNQLYSDVSSVFADELS